MLDSRDDDGLSNPDSKAGRLQRECLKLLREHDANGDIPTNGRFLFYELEQRGVVPKKYIGLVRTPLQDVSQATMRLRELGLVPWHWVQDETRTLNEWRYAKTVLQYLLDTIPMARIDLWQGKEPPLIICESRATMGVLADHAYQYLVPITATNGQCGGFIVTDIVPQLMGKRKVLYIGDYELRGPADQIEANTRRYIEKHTGRIFGDDEWVKVALTEEQVRDNPRLAALAITKLDKRYKPPKPYEAIECEALGQGVLVQIIRDTLDAMLPQPLDGVLERERRQRRAATAALQRLMRGRR